MFGFLAPVFSVTQAASSGSFMAKTKTMMLHLYPNSVCVCCLFLAGCIVFRSDKQTIQEELEKEYNAIVLGFRANDPSEWINRLTADFHLTLFNGAVQSRDWVVQYVANNAKTFHIDTLDIRIREITIREDQVIATVEQTSSRTFHDEGGEQRRLGVGAVQLERSRKEAGVCKLAAVIEEAIQCLREDGNASH